MKRPSGKPLTLPASEQATLPDPSRPSWFTHEELELLPTEARGAVEELVMSAYRELVLEAETALEKTTGEQFVFLSWLELLRAFRLRGGLTEPQGVLRLNGKINVEREIDRYLQLGGEKLKVGCFLLRAKRWRERCRQQGEALPVLGRLSATAASLPMNLPAVEGADPFLGSKPTEAALSEER